MEVEKEKPNAQSGTVSSFDMYANPFYHRINFETLDMVRIAVMSVTIAPIRFFLAGFSLMLVWPLVALFCWGRTRETYHKPYSTCMGYLRPLVIVLCRAVFFWGGFHWVRVKGRQAPVTEAPIVAMAPHSSYFDSLFIVYMDLPSVVAKSENEFIPIFGTIINFMRPVYVQREDPNSRINTIKEIQRRCEHPGEYPQILLYPEGTCTNGSCLISFKGGAFYPAVPVQPVCIRYHNSQDTTSWTWDGPGAFKVLWLTLCQFHNPVELEFLPVYKPTGEELNNAKLFANNVRDVMARSLEVPISNHTYDDCRLRTRATNNNLPLSPTVINFYKLHENLGLSFGGVQRLYRRIAVMCKNGSTKYKVDVATFAEYLSVPINDSLHNLYNLYDLAGGGMIDWFEPCMATWTDYESAAGGGMIDLREYIVSLALVSGPESTYEILQMAFCLFAIDGHIGVDHMINILRNVFGTTADIASEYFKLMDGDRDGRVTFDQMMRVISGIDEYTHYVCNNSNGDHPPTHGDHPNACPPFNLHNGKAA